METQTETSNWYKRIFSFFSFPGRTKNTNNRKNKRNSSNGQNTTKNGVREDISQVQKKAEEKFEDANQNKYSNIMTTSTNNRKERTPYEIGLYFGLTESIDEKNNYANKIRAELTFAKEETENLFQSVNHEFDQLLEMSRQARKEIELILEEVIKHQEKAAYNLRKTFISTEIIGISESEKAKLVNQILKSHIESLEEMRRSVKETISKLDQDIDLTKNLIENDNLYDKYKLTMAELSQKEEQIHLLEKGFAFGQSLKKNLDS